MLQYPAKSSIPLQRLQIILGDCSQVTGNPETNPEVGYLQVEEPMSGRGQEQVLEIIWKPDQYRETIDPYRNCPDHDTRAQPASHLGAVPIGIYRLWIASE
jgi:hypothetical protein